jgi:hypothetical protein
VRCIMYPNGMPVEVQVLQDRDLVLTELFQEEWLALNWAQAYANRLKEQGWHDSPTAERKELAEDRGGSHPQQQRDHRRQRQILPQRRRVFDD